MPIDIDGLSFEELLELNQRVVARLKMLESMQTHIEMMRLNLNLTVTCAFLQVRNKNPNQWSITLIK